MGRSNKKVWGLPNNSRADMGDRRVVRAHGEGNRSVGTHPAHKDDRAAHRQGRKVMAAALKGTADGSRNMGTTNSGSPKAVRPQAFTNPAPGDEGATNAALYQSGMFGPHGQ